MAVPTGPPLYPGSSTFPGSTTFPGQGNSPQIEVLYSTDDATDPTPTWLYAHSGLSGDVRGYTVDRGRGSELETMDAGTASITLSNRARSYDPNTNALLGPMNQWWIRTKFGGETQDRFKGYADSYRLSWPEKGKDSVTLVSCTDELKVLNLDALPTMNPPRDRYSDLVAFDDPDLYFPCTDYATNSVSGTGGTIFTPSGSMVNYADTPIQGDVSDSGFYSITVPSASQLAGIEATAEQNPLGDVGGLGQFSVEAWLKIEGPPSSNSPIMFSPLDGGDLVKWQLNLLTSGAVQGYARNSGGTTFTVTSSVLSLQVWYHLMWVFTPGTYTLYLNGVSQGTTAASGSFSQTLSSTQGSTMGIGHGASMAGPKFAQFAFYRQGFPQSRVQAHYDAGVNRGFIIQNTAARVGAVLDTVQNDSPRSLRTGAQNIVGVFMRGQDPLGEIRAAVDVDDVDAMFFCSRDGTLTFLDAAHRGVAPWNAVQLVFDDDGTDLSYMDAAQDVSEAFLFNEWNVTREGGLTQTVSDAASIARFKRRSQSITGLLVSSDGVAASIAAGKLSKYKDPFELIPTFEVVLQNGDVALGVLRRELGDMVEVIRRPLGGGSPIVQDGWIQSISEDGSPDGPIRVRLGVSPR